MKDASEDTPTTDEPRGQHYEYRYARNSYNSSTEEPRGRHEYRHEDLPIHITAPSSNNDDDCTDVSSVTTAHFQGGELFVPHMYPSTQSVGDLDDITVSEMGMDTEEVSEYLHPSVVGSEDTQATINLDDRDIKLELERLSNGNSLAEEIAPPQEKGDASEHQNTRPMVSDSDSLEQRMGLQASNSQKPVGFDTRKIFRTEENGPQARASPSIQDLVPLPMALPTAQEESSQPSDPGAYRMSPYGSLASREREEEEEKEGIELVDMQQPQEEPQLEGSDLVQAWPVSDELVIATPLQDQPENNRSGTIAGKISLNFFLVGIVAIATAIIASSIAVPLLFTTNDPNKAKYAQVKGKIMDAFGEAYFDNPQKERALQWIVYDDPRNSLGVEEKGQPTNLMQRFSLASFYFQTSYQQAWANCNPPLDTQPDTCYYADSYLSNKGITGIRWLTAAHECQWMGVACAGSPKQVTELRIWENNMTGTIPADEIAVLTELKALYLQHNNLTGSLSSKIFGSIPLAEINLYGNKLSGSIPFQALTLSTATKIWLGDNQLVGRIPTQIGLFQGTILDLSGNLLTGSLPEEMFTANNVHNLVLRRNMLTGTLSSSIGALKKLMFLELSGNPFHGSIPSQIGLLHKLQNLVLEKTNMNGTLPEELYQNQDLQNLLVGGCNLSGTISTRIGQLTNLIRFQIDNNNFHGTIPAELCGATTLCALSVQGNRNLTGSITEAFCSLLHQGCKVEADCKPRESNGAPAVFCPGGCCSVCCDAETTICLDPGAPS